MKHKDKLLHFAVSALLVSAGMFAVKILKLHYMYASVAVIGTLLIGLLKEVYDWKKFVKNHPYHDEAYASKRNDCAWDFLADLFGTVIGAIGSTLLIAWIWNIPL